MPVAMSKAVSPGTRHRGHHQNANKPPPKGSAATGQNTTTKRFYHRYLRSRYWTVVLKRTATILLCVYLAIPLWFYTCPWLRRQCIFLNNFNWPPFAPTNLSAPDIWQQGNARHLFINSEAGVSLGAWHLLPDSQGRHFSHLPPGDHFVDGRPVVIYCHGNSMNRAAVYRLDLYRLLRAAPVDAHVLTFDYRGYGDSTYASPSVRALVADTEAVYRWVQQFVPKSRIFLWGHSLGSGVLIQLAARLTLQDSPAAIVLESPFTNIPDATKTFPLARAHRPMPFFHQLISEPTRHEDTNFNSDQKIGQTKCPLMILHAADDAMVGVELGRRLYAIALAQQASLYPRAKFIEFEASLGLGHLWLSHHPDLPRIVADFMAAHCKSCEMGKP